MGGAREFVERLAAGVEPVPEQAAHQIAGAAAAAFKLPLFQLDIEAAEEPGDAVIGKATLTQDLDFAPEKVDYLGAGKALLVRAGCVTKFTSCDCDLINGVGARLCHLVPLKFAGEIFPTRIPPVPTCNSDGVPLFVDRHGCGIREGSVAYWDTGLSEYKTVTEVASHRIVFNGRGGVEVKYLTHFTPFLVWLGVRQG